jgi:hypothetical protein
VAGVQAPFTNESVNQNGLPSSYDRWSPLRLRQDLGGQGEGGMSSRRVVSRFRWKRAGALPAGC